MRTIRHVVETNAADALIINQVQPSDPRVEYLIERGFPFVTHRRSDWADKHAYYDFDNRAFGALAVLGLAAQGRKSLRLLAPPVGQTYAHEMILGATLEAERTGGDLQVIEGLNSDDPIDRIEAEIITASANPMDVDGVIFTSASSCMAAVNGLESAGRIIGQDIDEAIPFLKRFRPLILTQYEDAWSAGDFLAKAAIDRIKNPNGPPMQLLETPSQS
jgi:LacI family transcriptional regulator|tara:strand:- start:378 stop:1031 length:654 start_codon:yes stop_codon:yes gene_type:complete